MKRGRPSKRTEEVERRVIDGLSKGTPLSIICQDDDMPCDDTIRTWANEDKEFSRAIARAREAGFDAIALEALAIADEVTSKDTIETKFGEIPNKEWIMRSKLRVDTRLKLLAKWDPKRYGERIAQEITGANGGPIQSASVTLQPDQESALQTMLSDVQNRVKKP